MAPMDKKQIEIKRQIDDYNRQIELILSPNQFTLNNEITKITAKITELQEQCSHEFENGYCNWCYKSQEK
jgi:hypothetical protein